MADHAHSSPAATLDLIREGGTTLVNVCYSRLNEVKRALEDGNFNDAHNRTNELAEKLRLLAFSQANLGAFAGTFLTRADDVEEGMKLSGWGMVIGKEREEAECSTPGRTHVHVTLKLEDGTEHVMDGETELLGVREE